MEIEKKNDLEWDPKSGYNLVFEEDEIKKEKIEIKKVDDQNVKNVEVKKQIGSFEWAERKKQWSLIEKCPLCGHGSLYKRRDISFDPPKFLITCMSRPDLEVVSELKKKIPKDSPEYKIELGKLYCGGTFEIL